MSRRSNHSAEEKLKMVEACLAGKISICEAGSEQEYTIKQLFDGLAGTRQKGRARSFHQNTTDHIQRK